MITAYLIVLAFLANCCAQGARVVTPRHSFPVFAIMLIAWPVTLPIAILARLTRK